MPGSGKSTLGVLLAKAIGYSFVDTDLIISRRADKPLQRILDQDGMERFLSLEEEVGSSLDCDRTVVATGGSMVLSERAMEHLRAVGTVIFVNVPFEEIERRVKNIRTRGIVFHPNETLRDVFINRTPLYRRYADLTADVAAGADIEDTVEHIALALSERII